MTPFLAKFAIPAVSLAQFTRRLRPEQARILARVHVRSCNVGSGVPGPSADFSSTPDDGRMTPEGGGPT